MTETAEQSRSLATLGRVAAAGLVVLAVATYVGFDRSVCPGSDGPAMAEASPQAIVCGAGDFYPWAAVLWLVVTVGGLALQWYAVARLAGRRQLPAVLLPVLVPLLLFVVLRLPSESCTEETRRTEPAERCADPD